MDIWLMSFEHKYGAVVNAFYDYADAREVLIDYMERWCPPGSYDIPSENAESYGDTVNGNIITLCSIPVQ